MYIHVFAYLLKTILITWQGHSWIKELLSGSWLLRKTPFFIFPITDPGTQRIDKIISLLHIRESHPLSSPHPCSCTGGASHPCAWTINYLVNDCRSCQFYCQNSLHPKKTLKFYFWLRQELCGLLKPCFTPDLNTAASLWTTGSSSSPSFKRNMKSPTYLLRLSKYGFCTFIIESILNLTPVGKLLVFWVKLELVAAGA